MQATVSIIIPAFNEEQIIENAIKSAQNQTITPKEIIVVDNNSTDKTVEIAKKYPVKIIHEKTQGISYARNAGLNVATGDILARIDADTQLYPHWVETVIKDFEDESVVGITGPIRFYDIKHELPRVALENLQKIFYFEMAKIFSHQQVLFGSNMAIRRKTWELIADEVCNNDKKYHEDSDMTSHLLQYGKIVFDPQLVSQISARRVKDLPTLSDYALKHYRSIKHIRELQKLIKQTWIQ